MRNLCLFRFGQDNRATTLVGHMQHPGYVAVQSERERSDPLQEMEDGDDDYRENSPDRCSVEVQTEQYSMKADALPSPDAELNR
ncbi:unnamed protein product [Heligmosomoides polygyrus]|uniref:Uncharacterized protein n=1 Tax=Heligmosomoides polygyrus TaxID=6339 RepID=A0A183G009_HELPZ|nr:unnamed protein product [Heligmosomoides polygyrus]